jgi:hypothetical protein
MSNRRASTFVVALKAPPRSPSGISSFITIRVAEALLLPLDKKKPYQRLR